MEEVVLVMFKDDKRRDFPLTGGTTVVGRRQDCTLRIPTSDVSRQHCELIRTEDGVRVRDLGSSNGTFVNGKRVAQADLSPGDRVTVGPVTFVVQIDGKPGKITAADAAPALDEADAPVVTAGPGRGGNVEDDILDLGDIDFDEEDPTAAIEAMLDADDEDDEDERP